MKQLFFGLILLIPGIATAGLIGNDVNFQCPECGPPYNQTFTAELGGPELTPFNQFQVDVEDEYLRIDWIFNSSSIINPGHFNFSWDALDFSINDAVLDIASTIAYSFIFTESSVSIDISGIPVSRGDFVKIDLVAASVPEPGAVMLLGLGLLGIGFARKRKIQ